MEACSHSSASICSKCSNSPLSKNRSFCCCNALTNQLVDFMVRLNQGQLARLNPRKNMTAPFGYHYMLQSQVGARLLDGLRHGQTAIRFLHKQSSFLAGLNKNIFLLYHAASPSSSIVYADKTSLQQGLIGASVFQ